MNLRPISEKCFILWTCERHSTTVYQIEVIFFLTPYPPRGRARCLCEVKRTRELFRPHEPCPAE